MAITFNEDMYETNTAEGVATVSYTDKEVFNTGTDIEKSVLKDVFKHSGEFISATTDEAAKIATNTFNKDKEVDKVIIDFPYGPTGSGSVTAAVTREKTFRVPGTDKSISRPDIQLSVKHSMLKASKSHIKALQAEMLENIK